MEEMVIERPPGSLRGCQDRPTARSLHTHLVCVADVVAPCEDVERTADVRAAGAG